MLSMLAMLAILMLLQALVLVKGEELWLSDRRVPVFSAAQQSSLSQNLYTDSNPQVSE